MTWIDKLLSATEESESPRDYYFWAGMAALSAVSANNVYLDRYFYKLWPNVYVILVGRSGLRKGPPIALAKILVEAVENTRVFAGRSSIEAIIAELATARTSQNGHAPITDARGFLVSSEFASFIIQNDSALTILTDLYDRNYYEKEWGYLTRAGGKQSLKEPYLTLLGASNETHFKEVIPQNALGGGFVARTFIIYADKKARSNSLTEKPKNSGVGSELVQYLKAVGQLRGQFEWTIEAKTAYDAWYKEFDAIEFEDDTGTLERFGDSVLKVALLLSLSRGLTLKITDSDIREAIEHCNAFVPGSKKVALGAAGHSASREGTAVVLRHLLEVQGHATSKTKLLQRFWGHFNADELKIIVDSLVVAKAVSIEQRQTETGRGLGHYEDWIVLDPRIVANYAHFRGRHDK